MKSLQKIARTRNAEALSGAGENRTADGPLPPIVKRESFYDPASLGSAFVALQALAQLRFERAAVLISRSASPQVRKAP